MQKSFCFGAHMLRKYLPRRLFRPYESAVNTSELSRIIAVNG